MSNGEDWDHAKKDWYAAHKAQEDKLRAIYREFNGHHDKVLAAVAQRFGWTVGQAYIATEFLYRPENTN